MSITVGETKSITASVLPADAPQDVTATSYSDGVCKLIDGNKVLAVSEGTANIVFKTSDGSVSATLKVTVKAATV